MIEPVESPLITSVFEQPLFFGIVDAISLGNRYLWLRYMMARARHLSDGGQVMLRQEGPGQYMAGPLPQGPSNDHSIFNVTPHGM